MQVRHYAKSNGHPRTKRNPDAELDAYLAAREGHPTEMSETALCRGIPAVKATETRYSPRWTPSKRRLHGIDYGTITDADGNVTTVAKRQRNKRNRPTIIIADRLQTDRLLMARMGTIHTQDDN